MVSITSVDAIQPCLFVNRECKFACTKLFSNLLRKDDLNLFAACDYLDRLGRSFAQAQGLHDTVARTEPNIIRQLAHVLKYGIKVLGKGTPRS